MIQYRHPYAVTEIIEAKGQLASITPGKATERIADRIRDALAGREPRQGDKVKYCVASRGREVFIKSWHDGGWFSF
jgi:hypothetical protein